MSCRRRAARWSRLVLGLVLCSLATGAGAQAPQLGPGKKFGSRVEKRTYDFKEADKEMEYALFVPTTYAKDKPAPLVVALHGLGGNPQQIMRTRGLTDLAEKYGYLVVAPMGYNNGGWYGVKVPAGFNKGKGKDVPKNLAELSEKDVMIVLDLVRKEFNVDKKRIYLIGHSMGGAGAWHLGMKYPELWAGLAPIAPAPFGQMSALSKIKDIPVIVVQGEKDTLVKPASTQRWVDKLKSLDINYEYLEIPGAGHGDVISKGMPKVFEFFEKQHKKMTKAE